MKLPFLKMMICFLALAGVSLACALSGGAPAAEPTQAPTEPPAAPTQAPPTVTAAVEPTLAPPTALPQGVFSPPSEAECQQIQGQAAGALNVAFSLEKTGFTSVDGQTGAGCVMKASGTAVEFKSVSRVMKSLLGTFSDAIPDPSQSADSSISSIQGVWRGNTLVLIQAEWQPALGTNCPQGEPIESCKLEPEQQLYTVTLSAAISAKPPTLAGPAPTAAPTQGAKPTVATTFVKDQAIRPDAGPLQVTIAGSVNNGSYDRYRLNLAVRDSLDIQLSSPQQTAGFMLLAPDGQPMKGTENQKAMWYSAQADVAGEYTIIVSSILGRADYSLAVKVDPSGTATATSAPAAAGAYKPLPADECKQLRLKARDVLQVPLTMGEAAIAASASDSGTACTLTASGNGLDFTDVATVITALRGAFGDWTADLTLDADGPTGSSMGFRRGDDLLLVSVQWSPSPDAQCPADQPIASCNLTPEQQLYTVQIQAARR